MVSGVRAGKRANQNVLLGINVTRIMYKCILRETKRPRGSLRVLTFNHDLTCIANIL